MSISDIKLDMPVKPNFAIINTYRVIGIDRKNKKALIRAEEEWKAGITYQQWVSINQLHKVDILI